MRVHKIIKDGLTGGPLSPVNELRLSELYPAQGQAMESSQALKGLKNLLLTYSRGFAKVDPFGPVEQITAVGIDYAKKVAAHICLHSIKLPQVEQVFRDLVTAKKADLSERKLVLALDLLSSAINQRQSGAYHSI
jgi:hypothetical protein